MVARSVSGDPALLSILGSHTGFIQAFGIVAALLAIEGLVFFVGRREYGAQSYVLPAFTGLLFAYLLFFPSHRMGPEILYDRGWSYLGLFMAIFAGYSVHFCFHSIPPVARAVAARLRRPVGGGITVALWSMGAGLVVLALVNGLLANGERQTYQNYYHVINERVAADFRWIAEHTGPEQTVAMAEPSIGWAYPVVAGPGETVFEAVSVPWTTARSRKLREMLASKNADVPWLKKSGVSVLYTCLPRTFECKELTNDELLMVRPGVYLVPDSDDTR